MRVGIDSFAPHEVVELLLTLAIPRADVKSTAKQLLGRFGSLRGILDAEEAELLAIKGVGRSAGFAFKFLRALIPLYLAPEVDVQGADAAAI